MTSATMIILLGGLAGLNLVEDKAIATLPVAAVMVGNGVTMIPASLLMGRIGWRPGFILGALIGTAGATAAAVGLSVSDFDLFVAGNAAIGCAAGFAQYYRFAAADMARPDLKSIAISLVLAGGVIAAFIGPELAKWSSDLFFSIRFIGSYLVIAGLGLVAAVFLLLLDIPHLQVVERRATSRSLREIVCQPVFLLAVFVGMTGYGVTTLMMTATPLAMAIYGHGLDHTAFVIQWHTVAMFAPAFVTGWLILRFGVTIILFFGVALLTGCVISSLLGTDLVQFAFGLAVLGLGWNFTYIGATTLLTKSHKLEEQAKTRAANDFLMFGTVATASFVSGFILDRYNWQVVNYVAIPSVLATGIAVLWYAKSCFVRRSDTQSR